MDEIKKFFRALWSNPAILIVLTVVVLVIGYVLIKNKNSAVVAPDNGSSTYSYSGNQPNGPGYYLQEVFTPPPNVTVSNTQTTGGTTVTTPGPVQTVTNTVTKTVPAQYTNSGVTSYILGQPNKGRALVDQIEKQQRQTQNQKAQKQLVKTTGKKK